MSAFLDRFLPARTRAIALWLAVGGGAVLWGVSAFGAEVLAQLPVGTEAGMVPQGMAYVIQALAQFALVTLVMALLIRFVRAPRAIALYVLLASMLGAAIAVVSIPGAMVAASRAALVVGGSGPSGNPLLDGLANAMIALGVGLGAVAGAWITQTVTLDRIRDEDFSGDDPDGKGLRKHPGSRGWSFMGWEGAPASGDALIAAALVAVSALPALVSVVAGLLTPLADPGWARGDSIAAAVIIMLALIVAWFFSARLVVGRTGVVEVWLVPAVSILPVLATVAQALGVGDLSVTAVVQMLAVTLIPAVGTTIAALVGVAFARGVKPATIAQPDGPRRRAK